MDRLSGFKFSHNNMTYAYIRVSTGLQTTDNQRPELTKLAIRRELVIEKWIDETVSGSKAVADRKLSGLLKQMRKGDTLLVSELSRLGRSLFMIMDVLSYCMKNELSVITAKEGYELGDNINSKVLAFAFGLSAEIERNLISQRTKEALARLKVEGKTLGRPIGSRKQNPILKKHDAYIRKRISEGAKQIDIARSLKCSRHTVRVWLLENQVTQ